jgi:hypothetical protein
MYTYQWPSCFHLLNCMKQTAPWQATSRSAQTFTEPEVSLVYLQEPTTISYRDPD